MSKYLNAGKLLRESMEINEEINSLDNSEKKLYESVFKNPGISRMDLSLESGLGKSESNRILFSLAKKSLIHIVDNDKIFPMY